MCSCEWLLVILTVEERLNWLLGYGLIKFHIALGTFVINVKKPNGALKVSAE